MSQVGDVKTELAALALPCPWWVAAGTGVPRSPRPSGRDQRGDEHRRQREVSSRKGSQRPRVRPASDSECRGRRRPWGSVGAHGRLQAADATPAAGSGPGNTRSIWTQALGGRTARQPLRRGLCRPGSVRSPCPVRGTEGFLCLTPFKRDFEAIYNGSARYGEQETFGKDDNLGSKQIYLQAIKIRESKCEVFSNIADGSIWKVGCGVPRLLTGLCASHVRVSGSVSTFPQGSMWPWAGSRHTSRAVGEKGRPCPAGVPRTPLMALRFFQRRKTGERPSGVSRGSWKGPRRLEKQDSALESEGVAWGKTVCPHTATCGRPESRLCKY